MPGKPSDWDNSEFLMDLTLALYTGAQVNKGLTPAIKDSIEEYLKSRGYSTSFDAVRIMSKRQLMTWDASVHEDILICLFQHVKPTAEDWSLVMRNLQGKGYSFTEGALRQHVQKLRKNRDASGIQNAGSEPATPRKRAAVAKTPAKRAPKKKVAKSASIADDDDELEEEKMQLKMELDPEDDEMPSPSPAKRARAAPKSEPDEDSGSGNFEA